jgi:hypothetical protein
MALPSSGPLTFTAIQTEFGGTEPIGLNEYYRGGGLVPVSPATVNIPSSGTIAANNFYGASDRVNIPLSIATPIYNYDVYTQAIANPDYTAGISDIQVSVSPGVIVGSTATNTYAMLVPNSFSPSDTVTITNNGVIQGRGGNGGAGRVGSATGGAGLVGGNALYINRPTTIQNNSVVAGGGGGGGGASGTTPDKGPTYTGGGGGGGAGELGGTGGGGPFPGSPGTSTAGGAGRVGNLGSQVGGPGGGRGAAGSNGAPTGGANPAPGGAGGLAGYYVIGNPFVTWSTEGTRQGRVG